MKHIYSAISIILTILLAISIFSIFQNTSDANDVETLSGYISVLEAHLNEDHLVEEDKELTQLLLTDTSNTHWVLEGDQAILTSVESMSEQWVTLFGRSREEQGVAKFDVLGIEHTLSQFGLFGGSTTNIVEENGVLNYAVILCQFSDSTPEPYPLSQFETYMSQTFPGVGHYFDKISYGQLQVTSDVYGWYTLPEDKNYYGGDFGYNQFRGDCTAAADGEIYYPDYDGFIFISSEQYTYDWGGLGTLGSSYSYLDGVFKPYKITWVQPSNFRQSTIAHEIGHNIRWEHSSGPYGNTYDSRWDIMSRGRANQSGFSEYGAVGSDTILYHKERLGWIPDSKIFRFDSDTTTDQTVTVETHHKDQPDWNSDAYLAAYLPTDDERIFFSFEARYDDFEYDQIPDTGVVIHSVNDRTQVALVVDESDNNDPNDAGSIWKVGEIYENDEHEFSVEVVSQNTEDKSFDLRIQSTLPEVSITQYPQSDVLIDETVDIGITAADSNGTIESITTRIVSGPVVGIIGTADSFQWTPTVQGDYSIQTEVVDNGGNSSLSGIVTLSVRDPLNYWTSWQSDQSSQTNLPFVLTEFNDELFQSHVGLDNRIYTRSTSGLDPQTQEWSAWATSPDPFEFTDKAISMTTNNGLLYQTHVGGSNKIWTRSSTDGIEWSGWNRDEADLFEFTDKPVYQASLNNTLYQTHVGGSNKIWTRSSTDGIEWSGWSRDEADLFEFTDFPVTVTSQGNTLYQVHVGGGQGRVFTRSSTDGINWSSWSRGDDPLESTQSTVSITSLPNALIEAHKGLSNQIFTRFSFDSGVTWTDWSQYDPEYQTSIPVVVSTFDDTVWEGVVIGDQMYIRKFIGELSL